MNRFRSALLGLGLLMTVSATQAQGPGVRAYVPFDFVVGTQVLPAGEYVVSREGAVNQAISIRSTEGHGTILATTQTCVAATPAKSAKLVFHVVGGRYFLSQIWSSGYASGRQLAKSEAEIKLANRHAAKDVVVAAQLTR